MASIYTAPGTSFIDNFVNAAKYRDQRTDASNQRLMQGMEGLVKGGVEAGKWQARDNIIEKKKALEAREKEIEAELDRLRSARSAQASTNMDAIMQSGAWKGIPYPYEAPAEEDDVFVAPRGIGIFRKELL